MRSRENVKCKRTHFGTTARNHLSAVKAGSCISAQSAPLQLTICFFGTLWHINCPLSYLELSHQVWPQQVWQVREALLCLNMTQPFPCPATRREGPSCLHQRCTRGLVSGAVVKICIFTSPRVDDVVSLSDPQNAPRVQFNGMNTQGIT